MSLLILWCPPLFHYSNPAYTLLKYKPDFDTSLLKWLIPSFLYCLFGTAYMCLYYLTPSSHSCLVFSYMEPLAFLRLGHALSRSRDFPYAVPSLWNVFPPTVFLINVYSTVKSQVNLTSLGRNPGTLSLMYIPFVTWQGLK